jgi:ubiquinone/menaquinone biosynthesis C-methylase UbiE
VIYQHPLAYLVGLQGTALLRAFAGEHDEKFVLTRLDEVRQLLADDQLFGRGVEIPPITSVEGYWGWARTYDQPNGLIEVEEPIVDDIIAGLPVGVAIDVGCGTGRHARYLADRGHRVIGVDLSPEMVERAQSKAPVACFIQADLCDLPMADDSVDLVVCCPTLTHLPDLDAVLAEFVRILRPGGDVILSDAAGMAAGLRPPIVLPGPDGSPGHLPHHNRRASDYLKAALPLGLQVRRCEEPRVPQPYVDPDFHPSIETMLPQGPPNIWWLHHWFPDATNAAFRDTPVGIVWHFQLSI